MLILSVTTRPLVVPSINTHKDFLSVSAALSTLCVALNTPNNQMRKVLLFSLCCKQEDKDMKSLSNFPRHATSKWWSTQANHASLSSEQVQPLTSFRLLSLLRKMSFPSISKNENYKYTWLMLNIQVFTYACMSVWICARECWWPWKPKALDTPELE